MLLGVWSIVIGHPLAYHALSHRDSLGLRGSRGHSGWRYVLLHHVIVLVGWGCVVVTVYTRRGLWCFVLHYLFDLCHLLPVTLSEEVNAQGSVAYFDGFPCLHRHSLLQASRVWLRWEPFGCTIVVRGMGLLLPLGVLFFDVLALLLVAIEATTLRVLVITSMLWVWGPSVAVPGLLVVVAPVTIGKGSSVLTTVPWVVATLISWARLLLVVLLSYLIVLPILLNILPVLWWFRHSRTVLFILEHYSLILRVLRLVLRLVIMCPRGIL